MTANSDPRIDLTGIPGFRADRPAARDWPEPRLIRFFRWLLRGGNRCGAVTDGGGGLMGALPSDPVTGRPVIA